MIPIQRLKPQITKAMNGEKDRKEKNRRRTEKARQQRLLNRFKVPAQRLIEAAQERQGDSWAGRIQEGFFTPMLFSAPLNTKESAFSKPNTKQVVRERTRAVASLLVQIVRCLSQLLAPESSSIDKLLDVVVLDDSSCRIRGQGDGIPAIHTVMNTVQTVHIVDAGNNCESFIVPTPYISLQSQRTEDLHAAYRSYVLVSSSGVGAVWKAVEGQATQLAQFSDNPLPSQLQSLVSQCNWRCQVLVGDALKTNDAVFKLERSLLTAQNETRALSLRIKCMLHQLCLTRRPAVLSVDKLWSTYVRLAHLFEQISFRRQFAMALLQVLRAPGGFQRTLPQPGYKVQP